MCSCSAGFQPAFCLVQPSTPVIPPPDEGREQSAPIFCFRSRLPANVGARSRRTSLGTSTKEVFITRFVGARYIVPGKHTWLPDCHPPRITGALCGVRELAPAVCRPG